MERVTAGRLKTIATAEKTITAALAADPPRFAGEPSDEALRRMAEHLAVVRATVERSRPPPRLTQTSAV